MKKNEPDRVMILAGFVTYIADCCDHRHVPSRYASLSGYSGSL